MIPLITIVALIFFAVEAQARILACAGERDQLRPGVSQAIQENATDSTGELGIGHWFVLWQTKVGRVCDIQRQPLELLAKHPWVDPARIAIMGFLRGGHAALYASLKRFQRMHGPSKIEFAAYIAFFPDCTTTYNSDTDVSDRPIRIFHGTADDYNPVAPCRAYVERLRAKGKDVQLTEYEGAMHGFSYPAFKKPVKLEKAATTRECRLAETENEVIINAKTKEPFTYADPCVQYGPTIAYDEKAATEVRKAIKELVIAVLKP